MRSFLSSDVRLLRTMERYGARTNHASEPKADERLDWLHSAMTQTTMFLQRIDNVAVTRKLTQTNFHSQWKLTPIRHRNAVQLAISLCYEPLKCYMKEWVYPRA
jgi:hypothetical protein